MFRSVGVLGDETTADEAADVSGAVVTRVSARASTMRDGVMSSPIAVCVTSMVAARKMNPAIRKRREVGTEFMDMRGNRQLHPGNQSISMTSFTEPRIPASSGISAGTMLTCELNERNPRS